jgi:hypothetical protein
MSKQLIGIIFVVLSVFVSGAVGQTLSQEEQAFFQKHLPDVVRVEPKRLNDHAIVSVFVTPMYDFNVAIKMGDGGTSTQHVVVARVGEEFVPLSRPGQDGDCPSIQKMFRPGFTLTNDDVAETLQRALDIVYPLNGQDKRLETFRHKGNEWTFVRGKFFDSMMGFVLTTDATGAVTGVKYVLKLPS